MENYLIFFADMYLNKYVPKRREDVEKFVDKLKMNENVEIDITQEGETFLFALYVIKDSKRAYEILTTVNEATKNMSLLPPADVLNEIREKFGEKAALDVKETLEFFNESFKDYFENLTKTDLTKDGGCYNLD